MAQSWIRKHEPQKKEEIVGQESAVQQVEDFVLNYKKQKKKALLLFGPSGIGKTSAVYAVANSNNMEVFEVNASDFRDKKRIEAALGPALKQQSLFFRKRIILVDEIDGLSGMKDRGGLGAIVKLMQESAFPVILTAANPYDQKFSSVRSKCILVQFDPLEYTEVYEILKAVCEKENITYDETALKGLARRSGGDARAATNDLQTFAQHKGSFTKEDLEEYTSRNQIESMPNALVKVLKNKDAKVALSAFNNVSEDFDQQFLWIDENMPKEYTKKEDLAKAYYYLSRADVFKGRIRRWQHWRFLAYIGQLITAGVASAKSEKPKSFVQYKPTMRLLKIWQANMKYAKRKEISKKLSETTHTSTKRSLQDTLPYLKEMFKDKQMAAALEEELELDKDEVAWLQK